VIREAISRGWGGKVFLFLTRKIAQDEGGGAVLKKFNIPRRVFCEMQAPVM
jgi:hypothetical protein